MIGYVPTGVLDPTAIVIADTPAPGAGMVTGLKLTVVPVGVPEADKVIALLKPPLTVVVMVELPCAPCVRFSEEGEAATAKLADPEFCVIPRKATGVTSLLFRLCPPPWSVAFRSYLPAS